jgi:uncharacterized iron-regulated protein
MKPMSSVSTLSALSLFLAIFACPGSLLGQELPGANQDRNYTGHYRVFTGDGQPATLQDIVDAMDDVDAVLIGEIHTDPVGHWIEAELFRSALEMAGAGQESGARRRVALSLEMFERDVQGIVDEYLADLITESQFKASARPWEHYDEDYRPMVEAAKVAGVPVLAANAPRRYVNRVSRLGPASLEDLSPRALGALPPLPFPPPTDAYREEWTSLMTNMVMEPQCPVPDPPAMPPHARPDQEDPEMPSEPPVEGPPPGMPLHGGSFMENGVQAQTLWDASMAHAITTFLDMNPGGLVVHMVGAFHVKNFTGTPEKVQFYRPGTRSLVVNMDLSEDIETFDPAEHGGSGDFVILTDAALDLNYDRNCTQDD